ncbi:unnamed protein product [Pleuronectes platessa]|uniref:Uncharacterized protein n=1 Tax=Pleuronectes platessa TaxID=8262 RepID=A0A9N7YGB8_PLEPL|nr:unnamed protein product [Pleuronectes platessa]
MARDMAIDRARSCPCMAVGWLLFLCCYPFGVGWDVWALPPLLSSLSPTTANLAGLQWQRCRGPGDDQCGLAPCEIVPWIMLASMAKLASLLWPGGTPDMKIHP